MVTSRTWEQYEQETASFFRLLVELFGPNITLGALLACTTIMVFEMRGELLTTTRLALELQIPRSTVSRWVSQLYALKVIEHVPSPVDARVRYLRHRPEFVTGYKDQLVTSCACAPSPVATL